MSLRHLTIGKVLDLQESIKELGYRDALKIVRKFQAFHQLSDEDALEASRMIIKFARLTTNR